MKKIVALALAVIMTMTMFCSLAVTSSAEDVNYEASTKLVVTDNGDGTSNVKAYFYDQWDLGYIGCWFEITLKNVKDVSSCRVQTLYDYINAYSEEGFTVASKNTNLGTRKDPNWHQLQGDYERLDENTTNIIVAWWAQSYTPFSLKSEVLDEAFGGDLSADYGIVHEDYLEPDGSLLIADFNVETPAADAEDAWIQIHPINYDSGNFTVNTEIPLTFAGKRHGVGYWDKYTFNAEEPTVPAEVKVAGTSVRYANPQGLRFVAQITPNDQTVEDAGMVITAAGSDKSLDIPAKLYLDEAKTTYTAVIANLKAENYSRTFTATPYIVVDGARVSGTAGSANAHDVAVEILASDPDFGFEDRPDYAATAKALLNMYAAG